MTDIKEIELIIRDIIRTDEEIVSAYDSRLLCRYYNGTIDKLKKLCATKKDLIHSLVISMNEFFKLKQNPFFLFLALINTVIPLCN